MTRTTEEVKTVAARLPGHRAAAAGAVFIGLMLSFCAGKPAPQALPNILLISIDTLRADRLGAYGYPRSTSPHLDELAASGVRFADVLTPSTTTRLAHRAILRGTLAAAGEQGGTPLAVTLSRAGYATAALVDGGFMRARFGHDEGFQLYVDDLAQAAPQGARPVADRQGGGFAAILPRAGDWLMSTAEQPWFLFLHSYDVHCPYQPPAEDALPFTAGRPAPLDAAGLCGMSDLQGMDLDEPALAWISDLYDGGVHHADRLVGQFLATLEAKGVLENTLIAVISDHGESLGEGGWVGHNRLRPEEMQVPWLLSGPGVPAGKVVADPAHLADLVPTLLDYAGLPVPATGAGVSLKQVVEGRQSLPEDRLRVVETRRARALVQGPWMLVLNTADGRQVAMHPWPNPGLTGMDPAGRAEDIYGAWEELASRLDIPAGHLDEADIPADGDVRQELRTLGYVD